MSLCTVQQISNGTKHTVVRRTLFFGEVTHFRTTNCKPPAVRRDYCAVRLRRRPNSASSAELVYQCERRKLDRPRSRARQIWVDYQERDGGGPIEDLEKRREG